MTSTQNLLEIPEFIELNQKLNKFNIFDATDMRKREVKHTKFLSHLLNPNESHGCGTIFLNNFLMTLITRDDEQFKNIQFHELLLDHATTKSEWTPKEFATSERLDLIIIIPRRSDADLIIFIENKLDAKQGSSQLSKYDDLIKLFRESFNGEGADQFKSIKLFLTLTPEQPLAAEWAAIQYSETVLPSIRKSINSLGAMASPYLSGVLQDYVDLLERSSESSDELNDLAEKIFFQTGNRTTEIIEKLKNRRIDKPSPELRYLKTKYPKACEYLVNYDSDPRTKTLKWFHDDLTDLHGKTVFNPSIKSGLIFHLETSSRTHLRFSILTQENIESFEELDTHPKKWIESSRRLVFEVGMKLEDEVIKVWYTTVLGPIEESARDKILKEFKDVSNPGKIWARLSKATTLKIPKEEFRESFQKWFSTNLFSIENDHLTLSKDLLEKAEAANDSLKRAFQEVKST